LKTEAGDQFRGNLLPIFKDGEVCPFKSRHILSRLIGNSKVENHEISVYADYVVVLLSHNERCGQRDAEENRDNEHEDLKASGVEHADHDLMVRNQSTNDASQFE